MNKITKEEEEVTNGLSYQRANVKQFMEIFYGLLELLFLLLKP